MNTSNQSNTSNEKPRTVQDLIRIIQEKSKDGDYIFRGERRCKDEEDRDRKVSSKLYRDFEDIDSEEFDIEVIQEEMLSGAKKHTGHFPHSREIPPDFRPTLARMFGVREEDTAEAIDFEILTEIQHYGGKTNLIDFTTDYCIALFFACDGHHDKDGRLILLKTQNIKDMIKVPKEPRHRVVAQKSVFVRPPKGYIERHEYHPVEIPAELKEEVLQYLQKYHGIFTETIYNDLHGFIRNQDIHGDANTSFYRGLACSNRGDKAKSKEEKLKEYDKAIEYYDKAIEFKPDLAEAYNNRGCTYSDKGEFDKAIEDYNMAIELDPRSANSYNNRGAAYIKKGDFDNAIKDLNITIELDPGHAIAYTNRGLIYHSKGDFDNAIKDYNTAIELDSEFAPDYVNRGEAWLHLKEWDKARTDLMTSKDMGINIIESFQNDYKSVADFEQKHNIKLPEDIAEMLTPPQS